jgi:ATP-dependent Lon protease
MGIFRNEDDEPQGHEPNPEARVVPLLPLRDIVVFPHMVVPLFVGRTRSIKALEEAMGRDRELLLCAQREAGEDEPAEEDIYEIGTLGSIIQLLRLPDGTVKVLVEGKSRARIVGFQSQEPFFSCEIEGVEEPDNESVEIEALVRTVHSSFETFVKLNKKVPPETLNTVSAIATPGRLADTIVGHLNLKLEERQELLESLGPGRRLEEVYARMQAEIEVRSRWSARRRSTTSTSRCGRSRRSSASATSSRTRSTSSSRASSRSRCPRTPDLAARRKSAS